jgi:hypothetical protein
VNGGPCTTSQVEPGDENNTDSSSTTTPAFSMEEEIQRVFFPKEEMVHTTSIQACNKQKLFVGMQLLFRLRHVKNIDFKSETIF